MLLLHLLQNEDLYGYQITRAFKEKSNGVYIMGEAALYLVLYRLVEAGYISDYEKTVGLRRKRIYYHLEDSGREYFEKIRSEYMSVTKAIFQIMDMDIDV